MILLSNCRHGSEIAVYSGVRNNRPFLRKAASTPDGINDLRQEWLGWQWYVAQYSYLKNLPKAEQKEHSSYLRIDFPWIPGNKGAYQDGIFRNRTLIEAALGHYVDVWPQERGVPMHGDFSIDNLLFENNRVAIVDWEHFSVEKTPWGFDVLHLIFETLWYDVQEKHTLPPILKIISPWMERLRLHSIFDAQWGKTPLAQLSAWMIEHRQRWGTQAIRFPDKFPVLRFSAGQIRTIDEGLH
jgi:hypothetical protein